MLIFVLFTMKQSLYWLTHKKTLKYTLANETIIKVNESSPIKGSLHKIDFFLWWDFLERRNLGNSVSNH